MLTYLLFRSEAELHSQHSSHYHHWHHAQQLEQVPLHNRGSQHHYGAHEPFDALNVNSSNLLPHADQHGHCSQGFPEPPFDFPLDDLAFRDVSFSPSAKANVDLLYRGQVEDAHHDVPSVSYGGQGELDLSAATCPIGGHQQSSGGVRVPTSHHLQASVLLDQ
jgi:hypothetical protein